MRAIAWKLELACTSRSLEVSDADKGEDAVGKGREGDASMATERVVMNRKCDAEVGGEGGDEEGDRLKLVVVSCER